MAVGLASWSVCAWGQAEGAQSTADSYREQLKAEAADPQQSTSSDSSSREAYKDHLRRLSGDTSASDIRPTTSQNSTASQNGLDDGRTESPVVGSSPVSQASDVGAGGHSALQPVSLATGTRSLSGMVLPPQVSPGTDCSDAYCQQLRSVANGVKPEVRLNTYEPGRTPTTEGNFVRNLAFDQVHIWESPFKLRDTDSTWILPFGVVTGGLIATDRDVSKQLVKPAHIDTSKQISNLGLYSFIGAGAGFYGLGLITNDDHKRETGLLAGEAFINATLVGTALKGIVGRERPFESDHFGHIGRGGSSFPSEHALGSWAIASVIAHEYPNPFIQIASYGLASAVSVTRLTAGQHFPSDVFVGATFGYLIGRKMYRDHHNPELGGSEYGTFIRERPRDAEHSGSAYVPLESWVYPVIDRLAGLGYIHSNFDSERPFTRLECARLASEAAGNASSDDTPANVLAMIDELQREFAPEADVWAGDSENRSAVLESVYTRATEITGPVLRDGYHFGQTLYNDYGRPYGRGFNNITGFSARATSGPLVFYFRGEYQHAPGNPDYTAAQKALIDVSDIIVFHPGDTGDTPVLDNQFPATDRFRILDAYVGLNFAGNRLTLGQQSLWWGPGSDTNFALTDNAQPLRMIRFSNTSPVEIPFLSKFLGPLRYDMFLGQLSDQHFLVANGVLYGPHLKTQPFIQGQRFTFKPTENFEFGFSRTGIFGGDGKPLTLDEFLRATFSAGNTAAGTLPGSAGDPGDRRSFVDISYRVPKVRDWLTVYLEEFSEDELSPLFQPRSAAMRPGIYMPKIPKLNRVDLRLEGTYTDIPSFGGGRGFFYFNDAYRNGYTNDGNLLGSWIGREGHGVRATSTVWLSKKNTIQMGYRAAVVDKDFIEGGRYADESATATFAVRSDLMLSAGLQYEKWHFPALARGVQTNFSSSIQLTFLPQQSRRPASTQ
ncbi:MAG TPA: capsule assembly Wzi family protein [Terriglobales bacterium]|nr:capsule assembly Wzi family protein [Terriglobales bacterium]